MVKFLFVTGGVISGVGKGTIASSIGLLLQGHGIRVSAVKIDPYLNVDAGKMSPHEHGEVYVLADGTECDLDLGNYERFLEIDLSKAHSITTGQVYAEVIARERDGRYLGRTVQVVPHVTDHIAERIDQAARIPVGPGEARPPEIVIVELGNQVTRGTVGDIESEPFLHVISRFAADRKADVCVLHVGYAVSNNGEIKTKPLQHSMQALRARGVSPDVLCVRCDVVGEPIGVRSKLSSSCYVPQEHIVFSGRVNSVYEVPNLLRNQGIVRIVTERLGLPCKIPCLERYERLLTYSREASYKRKLRVGIIAKYTGSADTYLSLTRALEHAAAVMDCGLDVVFLSAETFETGTSRGELDQVHGIIIPGGFGERGIEGKIKAIGYARDLDVPVLGLCLGMQLLAIEEARRTEFDANSTEFDHTTANPVVDMVEQGEMRLGDKPIEIVPGSIAERIYGGTRCIERHRHRYGVNKESAKLRDFVTGYDPNGVTAEIMEFPGTRDESSSTSSESPRKWRAIGVQFHPEYTSRNSRPHPIFVEFLRRIG